MNRLAPSLLAAALALPLAAAAQGAAPGGKTASGKTELTWYGHAAFLVKTPGGTTLAIDPWLSNPAAKDKDAAAGIQKLDFILVTHGHSDHVGDAMDLARRTGAKLVATFDLARALIAAGFPKDQATLATSGNVGGTIPLGDDASVTIVPAVHSSSFQKDETSPPLPAGSPVGFVIRVKGGPTLYHTGDTDVTSDMKLVGDRFHPDLMLACIGGHFTMDPAGAALAASLVRAKQIVPMHFGTYPVLNGTPAELARELKARRVKATVLEMKVGETRTF